MEVERNIPDEAYVLVEGQGFDADFYSKWLNAAVKAQALWEQALNDKGFAKKIERLLILYIPDFGLAAVELMLRLDHKRPSFVMAVDEEESAGEFVMMVEMGFFQCVGDHYVMALPFELTITSLKVAAAAYAETEDEHYYLHPCALLITACLAETNAKQVRLHAMKDFAHSKSIHGMAMC
jgi:hypothetical protein